MTLMWSSKPTKSHSKGGPGRVLRRLEKCLQKPENQTCSECANGTPTRASIILPTTAYIMEKETKKEMVGVFCCHKCCSYHMELGRDICQVKNLKVAEDCKYFLMRCNRIDLVLEQAVLLTHVNVYSILKGRKRKSRPWRQAEIPWPTEYTRQRCPKA